MGIDKTAALGALKKAIEKDKGAFLSKILELINPEKKPSFFVYIMKE